MTGAFQADAFQNDAFQVEASGPVVTLHSSGGFTAHASLAHGVSRAYELDTSVRQGSYAAMGWGSHVLVQWVPKETKQEVQEAPPPATPVRVIASGGVFYGHGSKAIGTARAQRSMRSVGVAFAGYGWVYGKSSTSDPELEEMLQILLEIA